MAKMSEQTDAVPEWVSYLEHRFGKKLWGDDWRTWLRFISGPASDNGLGAEPDDGEILAALKHAKADDKITFPAKITVDTVITFVRKYRQRTIYGGQNSTAERIEHIKQRMKDAETFAERWDLLCDETETMNERYEIDAWARKKWPDWDSAVEEIKAAWKADDYRRLL